LSAELIGWHDEDALDHRRRLRNALVASLALHVSLFAAFALAPTPAPAPLPQVLAVELVAAPASPARSARPAKPPPAPVKPAPAEPPPAAAPAPPQPKAPVQVLPEESPGRIREAKPEPAPAKPEKVAKVEPKPEPKPAPPRREEAVSYEEAMAELGLDETEEFLESLPGAKKEAETSSAEATPTPGAETSQAGVKIPPELAEWNLKTRRRIQNSWVMPSQFRDRALTTELALQLSATGELVRKPEVVRSSGDYLYDDNTVRAVMKAAPLPPPPRAGPINLIFRSEDY
jgi:colicin import membrane protein